MAEPTYTPTTERLYLKVPEFYRVLDAQNDWHFKKYISAIGDQLDEIETLVARLEYIPLEDRANYYASLDEFNTYSRPAGLETTEFGYEPIGETSDLLDARTSDYDWLPYIAQLIGADISGLTTESERRDAIIYNYLGFRAGSREALEDAAKRVLTGDKYVRVYPHRDGSGGSIFSEGTQWDILIITKSEETPSVEDIVAEILRKGAKPAGVVLHHIAYALTWEVLEVSFPNWSAIEAAGSWNNLEFNNADLLPV